MNTVRSIQKLNARELESAVDPSQSWHTDYRDTAFIYIGGFPFDLSEGDIITIFSQFGEPTWIKLARDKETGKSRGFCWLKYEDQRSTDLAVDNLGGATVMGRVLRVDHTRYKPRDDEDMRDNTMGELDAVDERKGKRRKVESESESESEHERPMLREEIELEKLMEIDDDDPMKESMVQKKKEEVAAAVRKYDKARRKEKRDSGREKRHRRHCNDSRDRSREHRRITDGKEDKRASRKHRSPSFDEKGNRRRRDDSRERNHARHRDRDDRNRDRRHHGSDEGNGRHREHYERENDLDKRRRNRSRS